MNEHLDYKRVSKQKSESDSFEEMMHSDMSNVTPDFKVGQSSQSLQLGFGKSLMKLPPPEVQKPPMDPSIRKLRGSNSKEKEQPISSNNSNRRMRFVKKKTSYFENQSKPEIQFDHLQPVVSPQLVVSKSMEKIGSNISDGSKLEYQSKCYSEDEFDMMMINKRINSGSLKRQKPRRYRSSNITFVPQDNPFKSDIKRGRTFQGAIQGFDNENSYAQQQQIIQEQKFDTQNSKSQSEKSEKSETKQPKNEVHPKYRKMLYLIENEQKDEFENLTKIMGFQQENRKKAKMVIIFMLTAQWIVLMVNKIIPVTSTISLLLLISSEFIIQRHYHIQDLNKESLYQLSTLLQKKTNLEILQLSLILFSMIPFFDFEYSEISLIDTGARIGDALLIIFTMMTYTENKQFAVVLAIATINEINIMRVNEEIISSLISLCFTICIMTLIRMHTQISLEFSPKKVVEELPKIESVESFSLISQEPKSELFVPQIDLRLFEMIINLSRQMLFHVSETPSCSSPPKRKLENLGGSFRNFQMQLVKISSNFFQSLPNFQNNNLSKCRVNFLGLEQDEEDILNEKIYEPYFISYNTIIEYQDVKEEKISIMEVIETFLNQKKQNTKLYFKVSMSYGKQSDSLNNSCVSSPVARQKRQSDTIENLTDPHLELTYQTNDASNNKNNKYDFQYFEFEIRTLKILNDTFNFLDIRNVTQIIKNQQKISDTMYQDAIEANYSHEQMTPLNSILGNSKIVFRRFLELHQTLIEYDKCWIGNQKNEETLKLLNAINQSGQAMAYYNQNQIQRMKIEKKEFNSKNPYNGNPNEQIIKVLSQFEPLISRMELDIIIAQTHQPLILRADWSRYELILFNIIQNSVKYNVFKGSILFLLRCLPLKQDFADMLKSGNSYVLETEIIDTGLGISEERQKMLFVPFLELKMKQNLSQVENNSIGMGLTCSSAIACALGGDITLKKSVRGFTSFAFKVPVKKVGNGEGQGNGKMSLRHEQLKDYLEKVQIQSHVLVDLKTDLKKELQRESNMILNQINNNKKKKSPSNASQSLNKLGDVLGSKQHVNLHRSVDFEMEMSEIDIEENSIAANSQNRLKMKADKMSHQQLNHSLGSIKHKNESSERKDQLSVSINDDLDINQKLQLARKLLLNKKSSPLLNHSLSHSEEVQDIDLNKLDITESFSESVKAPLIRMSLESSVKGCQCEPRILVVDDIQFNILPVKLMIQENFQLEIEEAHNGQVALEKFKQGYEKECGCPNRAFNLIFMDLQMPVMGGIEASKLINEMQKDEELAHIVALTAFTNKKSIAECHNVGIKSVLNKPLNYKELHKVMWKHYFRVETKEYPGIYKKEFKNTYVEE